MADLLVVVGVACLLCGGGMAALPVVVGVACLLCGGGVVNIRTGDLLLESRLAGDVRGEALGALSSSLNPFSFLGSSSTFRYLTPPFVPRLVVAPKADAILPLDVALGDSPGCLI